MGEFLKAQYNSQPQSLGACMTSNLPVQGFGDRLAILVGRLEDMSNTVATMRTHFTGPIPSETSKNPGLAMDGYLNQLAAVEERVNKLSKDIESLYSVSL